MAEMTNEDARRYARALKVVAAAQLWLKATRSRDYHAQCDALRYLGSETTNFNHLEPPDA